MRGRINPALTPLGWEQMRRATALDDQHRPTSATPMWSHIISSPLKRCGEFAKRTADETSLDLNVIDQWQEIDYGDWDGMLASEWREVAAEQFRAFRKDLSALVPPNGEAYLDFKDRVLNAWQQLGEFEDGDHILVVTHGGVLRVVLPTVLGMPLNRSFPLHIPFACFSRISLTIDAGKISPALIFHNGAEYEGGADANQ